MARQIRWDNINVPNAGGALGAFDAGASRISQSIGELQGLAQEQTRINQLNYDNQAERNTANLIEQLNQAGSSDALKEIDFEQYGNQVDREMLNAAFSQNQERLTRASNRAEDVAFREQQREDTQAHRKIVNQLAADKWDVEKKSWGQPVQMYKKDGTTEYVQFNKAGEKRIVDGFGKPVPGSKLKPEAAFNNLGIQLRKSGEYTDPKAYAAALTRAGDDLGLNVRPEWVDAQTKLFENSSGVLSGQETVLNTTQTNGQLALDNLDSQLNVADQQFQKEVGWPADLFELSKGTRIKLGNTGEVAADTNWFSGNVKDVGASIATIRDAFGGRVPTEEEVNYLVQASMTTSGFANENSTIQTSILKELATQYIGAITDPNVAQIFSDYTKRKEGLRTDLTQQIEQAHTGLSTQFKEGNLKGQALDLTPRDFEPNVTNEDLMREVLGKAGQIVELGKEVKRPAQSNTTQAPLASGSAWGGFRHYQPTIR
ncbi:hypothetical protein [Vibrio phage vB_VhaP_PG11]|nr:hypothetical protein [Vibrio phage vB_VhaP_PG11]